MFHNGIMDGKGKLINKNGSVNEGLWYYYNYRKKGQFIGFDVSKTKEI